METRFYGKGGGQGERGALKDQGGSMEDGEYVNGKKEGRWVTCYASGAVRSEGEYRNGHKHGPWTLYHKNGSKQSEATFADGKYTGLYTAYHENGKRRFQGRYNEIRGTSADGTKEGPWHDYEEDGETIRRRITYARGSRARPDEFPPF